MRDSTKRLKVKPGSHRRHLGDVQDTTAVSVAPGDVIVFDVRMDHAGQLPSLSERALRRILSWVLPPLQLDHEEWFARLRALVRRYLLPNAAERLAVYLTFGPDSPCTYEYEREGRGNHGPLPAPLDALTCRRLANRDIGLIRSANSSLYEKP